MVNRSDILAVPRDADASLRTRQPPMNHEDGEAPARHQAWRREMERAQLTGWFKSAPSIPLHDRQPSAARASLEATEHRAQGHSRHDGRAVQQRSPEADTGQALPARREVWGLESAGMRIPTATIVQSSAATSRLRGGLGFDVSPERPMAERVVPAAVSLSQPRIGVLEGALEEPMAVEGAPPDVPADALAWHFSRCACTKKPRCMGRPSGWRCTPTRRPWPLCYRASSAIFAMACMPKAGACTRWCATAG